jgi:hypothetical protein
MRSQSRCSDTDFPVPRSLAVILASMAVPVWSLAGLTLFVRGVLVLLLSAILSLVLAPLVLAYRSWPDWRWTWLCRPDWFREPWFWSCWCWLSWPRLCWSWLSEPRHRRLGVSFNKLRPRRLVMR